MSIALDFISPYQEDRDIVKIHEQSGLVFIEIFVDCKLESAEREIQKDCIRKHGKARSKTLPELMIHTRHRVILKST